MGKISKIEVQKKRKDRYSIFIDGKFQVGLSEKDLLELGIKKDQELDEKDLKIIKDRSNEAKVREKAIRLLSIRPQSEDEIRRKLEAKKYDVRLIKKTISWLKKESYINDKKFAKIWIDNRKNFHPLGKRRLFLELNQKSVNKDIIEKEINKISNTEELSAASRIATRRIISYRGLEKYKKREKIVSFLSRRGYSWDIIKGVIDKLKL